LPEIALKILISGPNSQALKTSQFFIFILIVTTVYGLANYFIFHRAMQAVPEDASWKTVFIVLFWVQAASFILARFLERSWPCNMTEVITWIGSLWLAAMLYFMLSILVIDIARLTNHFLHFFPAAFYTDYAKTKVIVLYAVMVLVFLISLGGFINARFPRIRKLDLTIHKKVTGDPDLKIVMVSDIHLGTLIAKRRADFLTEKINSLNPDIILLAGDVVDEDIKPVIRRNLGENLKNLKSKFGVYAIPGNHEYIGGAAVAIKYLREHGITVLQDTSVLVDHRFYIAGRDDRDRERFTGQKRKSIQEVLKDVDHNYPIIMMDHQPFHFEDVVAAGVDLQLSGHTHHGQLWPLNYITLAMYEVSWGYKMKGNTQFYVSSGFGSWGPPVRTGNRPEIVEIMLHFR